MASDGWTDDAIGAAFSLPPRTVKRVRLCSNILSAILDQMATGITRGARTVRLARTNARPPPF